MADAFDQAQAELQARQRAYLEAMAQAGTAGAQTFQQAQQDIAGQKAATVQAALAEAARRGAPADMQRSVEYQIGAPYDRGNFGLTLGNTSRQQSLAATQAAGNTVMEQALANIPALREGARRQAEAQRFKEQQQAAADALEMQLKQMDLQIAQANLARAQSGGSDGGGRDPGLAAGTALDNELKRRKLDETPGESSQDVLNDALNRLGGSGSRGYGVLSRIIQEAGSLPEALDMLEADKTKTPHGNPLDKGAIRSFLMRYDAAQ